MNPDAGFWAAYTAPTMGAKNSSVRAESGSAIAPVLPQPKRLKRGTGGFPLSAETPLLLPSTTQPLDRRLLLAAEAACREIHDRTGKPLSIARPRTANFDGPSIVCRIDPDAALEPEIETARDAYCLRVNATGVDLAAPTSDGIRYGLQTLCQLVPPSGRIPSVEIRDQPDFRDRGIMLDVSRGKVPTEETLEALVDLCSRLRLNVLMLYVEHTFDFKRHPEIGMDSSPLSAETILSLDRYAADRGVELVPCLQSLGHMEELLSIDRYAHLAESDRRWSVAPDHPDTRKLLKDLYDEFLPLFSSTRFNANCDEPFDLGKRRSGGRRANTTPGKLFTDHIGRLEGLAAQH
jgi:hexosaminidase